jgi:AsmA protein
MIEFASGAGKVPLPRKTRARAAAAVALALVLVLVALWSVQRLLPTEVLSRQVAAQIQRATGLTTKISGRTEIRFFFRPRLIIRDIHIADPKGAVRIDAPKVIGYLRLLPLLAGRFEIGQAVLYQPKFYADLDRSPGSRAGNIQKTAQAGRDDVQQLRAPLGTIDIVGGQARLATKKLAATIAIDAIDMRASWPRLGASANFAGQLIYRAAPVRFQGWLEEPLKILRGGDSAGVFQIKSDLLAFWTSGHLSGGPKIEYAGSITASAPSLRTLAETIGYSFSKHGTFADLSLSCDVDVVAGNATFTNLTLRLDGNDYEGNLEIQDIAHDPQISGTLASDFLDVTPFLTGLREPAVSSGLWSRKPLDLPQLDLANLDLRVSATRLRLYDLEVHDAALSLLTKPGMIDLALAEATSNKGAIRGRFGLTETDHLFNLRLNGSGSGIDLQPMLFEGQRSLTGSLDASLRLESSGGTIDMLMRGLRGEAAFSASNGSFNGVDLLQTLSRADGRKPGEKLDTAPGTTNYDHLTLNLTLANGKASVADGLISGPNLQVGLAGTIDVGQRQFDLLSLAEINAPTGKTSRTLPVRFELKGPWSAPRFFVGPANLVLPKPAPHKDILPATTMSPPPAQE